LPQEEKGKGSRCFNTRFAHGKKAGETLKTASKKGSWSKGETELKKWGGGVFRKHIGTTYKGGERKKEARGGGGDSGEKHEG